MTTRLRLYAEGCAPGEHHCGDCGCAFEPGQYYLLKCVQVDTLRSEFVLTHFFTNDCPAKEWVEGEYTPKPEYHYCWGEKCSGDPCPPYK